MTTPPGLFDSHAHLQHGQFDRDRDAVLTRARHAGVRRILNLATRLADAHTVVELAHHHPECLAAVGVHPGDLDDWSDATEAGLRTLAPDPRVVVWGEIGLDYYRDTFPRDLQRRVFRRQLALAREHALPVSIHCREAYDDMIADLEAENGPTIGGVAHCFGGTADHARRLLDMGFALGVGGSSTYPRSQDLRDLLRTVGVAALILETDSPYLAPQTHRGKRNEPAYVALTAEALAETLEIEFAALREACWRNTLRAFRLNADASGRA
ncbi:MAG: TatD family hydrolase [Candidatus Sumerlaeia bacterium]|nr:TatD family hydrolase [Candidatus Sumerlaeia bacterium]